jgi:regulatory protein
MENSERFFSFEDSKVKIENWCGYRDRSVDETRQKLFSYGMNPQQVEKIISELQEMNFLDDKRFAESFVTGKFRIKAWGKSKIYAHLLQKRIAKELITEALASIDYDEYLATAQKLIDKKWTSLEKEKDTWTRKQKVFKFLASRGFDYDVIQESFANLQL